MISADHMHCALLDPSTGQYDHPVDCGKLTLCQFGMVCVCGATACAVRDQGVQLSFDVLMTTDGAFADGSVDGRIGPHNVHFTKNR
jgi:hypothetical protein